MVLVPSTHLPSVTHQPRKLWSRSQDKNCQGQRGEGFTHSQSARKPRGLGVTPHCPLRAAGQRRSPDGQQRSGLQQLGNAGLPHWAGFRDSQRNYGELTHQHLPYHPRESQTQLSRGSEQNKARFRVPPGRACSSLSDNTDPLACPRGLGCPVSGDEANIRAVLFLDILGRHPGFHYPTLKAARVPKFSNLPKYVS